MQILCLLQSASYCSSLPSAMESHCHNPEKTCAGETHIHNMPMKSGLLNYCGIRESYSFQRMLITFKRIENFLFYSISSLLILE